MAHATFFDVLCRVTIMLLFVPIFGLAAAVTVIVSLISVYVPDRSIGKFFAVLIT